MRAGIPFGQFTIMGAARGVSAPSLFVTLGTARLPTDPIGNFTLTLTNLIVGSTVRVEIAGTGAEVETRVADATSEVFTVPAYSVGNALNSLRVKVRKGSESPTYKPFETQATASVGSQSIFIAQQLDE